MHTMEEDLARLAKPQRVKNPKLIKKLQREATCIISGASQPDVHHLFTVGHRGDDVEWNLVPLAHIFHRELHDSSIDDMAEKYPRFLSWLIDNQWYFDNVMKKWRHAIK